jgi:hypothetical protein
MSAAEEIDRVPASLADIGPEWLGAHLRAGGLDGAAVRSVAVEPIGGFSGITGQIGRLRVEWEDATGLPETFVAKAPT